MVFEDIEPSEMTGFCVKNEHPDLAKSEGSSTQTPTLQQISDQIDTQHFDSEALKYKVVEADVSKNENAEDKESNAVGISNFRAVSTDTEQIVLEDSDTEDLKQEQPKTEAEEIVIEDSDSDDLQYIESTDGENTSIRIFLEKIKHRSDYHGLQRYLRELRESWSHSSILPPAWNNVQEMGSSLSAIANNMKSPVLLPTEAPETSSPPAQWPVNQARSDDTDGLSQPHVSLPSAVVNTVQGMECTGVRNSSDVNPSVATGPSSVPAVVSETGSPSTWWTVTQVRSLSAEGSGEQPSINDKRTTANCNVYPSEVILPRLDGHKCQTDSPPVELAEKQTKDKLQHQHKMNKKDLHVPGSKRLKIHMTTHTGEQSLLCLKCDEKFSNTAFLNDHMRSHISEVTTDRGEKNMSGAKPLKIHMTTPTGEQSLLCLECDRIFATTTLLNDHMVSHTREKLLYQCTICDEQFATATSLVKHKICHKGGYNCTKCDKTFQVPYKLKKHMKSHDKHLKIHMTTHTDKVTCASDLVAHMKSGRDRRDEELHQCPTCNMWFLTYTYLTDHMRTHRENSEGSNASKSDGGCSVQNVQQTSRTVGQVVSSACVEQLPSADIGSGNAKGPTCSNNTNSVQKSNLEPEFVDAEQVIVEDSDPEAVEDDGIADETHSIHVPHFPQPLVDVEQIVLESLQSQDLEQDAVGNAELGNEMVGISEKWPVQVPKWEKKTGEQIVIEDSDSDDGRTSMSLACEPTDVVETSSSATQWTVSQDRALNMACLAGTQAITGETRGTGPHGYPADTPSESSSGYYDDRPVFSPAKHNTKDHIRKDTQAFSGEKTCQCPVCKKQFKHLKLQGHMETHKAPCRCLVCCKAFASLSGLKDHLDSHTGEKSLYNLDSNAREQTLSCLKCDAKFTSLDLLEDHIDTHSSMCPTCGKMFSSRTRMLCHFRIHKEHKRPFECPVCHDKHRSHSHLQMHMKVHEGPEYKCLKCGDKFSSRASFVEHMGNHEGQKLLHCSMCDYQFTASGHLKAHMRVHKREMELFMYKCKICHQKFPKAMDLARHVCKDSPRQKELPVVIE